jgi:hypothetical protein
MFELGETESCRSQIAIQETHDQENQDKNLTRLGGDDKLTYIYSDSSRSLSGPVDVNSMVTDKDLLI